MTSVLTSSQLVLPGQDPRPGTVEYSADTHKILAVHLEKKTQADYADGQVVMDVGDLMVLPGLVE